MEDSKASLETTTIIDLDTGLMREQLEHAEKLIQTNPKIWRRIYSEPCVRDNRMRTGYRCLATCDWASPKEIGITIPYIGHRELVILQVCFTNVSKPRLLQIYCHDPSTIRTGLEQHYAKNQ